MIKEKNVQPASEYYGELTFNLSTMRKILSESAFKKVLNVMEHGERLDVETANMVALALKDWAVSRGCTHYTHWFQPMTGYTAEKHDSFIQTGDDGRVMETLSGQQLIQGEPDASSFPSGGIRTTFEARGYTIWDPGSPAFILEYPHGNTLCIPSIFVSYTGETLDKKAPLLRSQQILNSAALGILKLFKNSARRVVATLGAEQEYFLIDRTLYRQRTDIVQTGRTLFGITPPRHQQLADRYFGNICERAFAFMTDVEREAYKLGIPLKTRHNEVAPNQFEFAPIFEEVNLAVDHNQLLMNVMQRIALRHDLAVLFHEKPFQGINGSGKHCNWSMSTDSGENLLNPGKTPHSNLQFLVFLSAVVRAVHAHSHELLAGIASAANDLRLGAHEAPPAIISIFLGRELSDVLNNIGESRVTEKRVQEFILHGVEMIPEISRDTTDRNRTSPFAFTGNKFEFRAVGGSASTASPMMVLNTAVAKTLTEMGREIEMKLQKGEDFNMAIMNIVRESYLKSRDILFEGDNYSEEWVKEAKRRGLPIVHNTPEAFESILGESSKKLFVESGVLPERELEARYNINMDNYIIQLEIEANVCIETIRRHILPAVLRYLGTLNSTYIELVEILGEKDAGAVTVKEIIVDISAKMASLRAELKILEKKLETALKKEAVRDRAFAMVDVRKQCVVLRSIVDSLEEWVEESEWPVPSYGEMLLHL